MYEDDSEWPGFINARAPRLEEAERWREQLLARFGADMNEAHGDHCVVKMVEGKAPHISRRFGGVPG